MPFRDEINRLLRDFEGYTGDGRGSEGELPVGDRSTAKRPIVKRDLREAMLAMADVVDTAEDFIEVAQSVTASETIEVTVGPGGQYSTINEALGVLSTRVARRYQAASVRGVVRLLTGFVMAEQVIVRDGMDLGWIEIISNAAGEVTVTRAAITTVLSDERKPIFGAIGSARLPVVNCRFLLGAGAETNVDGIACFGGARALLGPGVGMRSFSRNLGAYYGSEINLRLPGITLDATSPPAYRPNFSGAASAGAYVTFNSRIGVPYGNFDGSGNHGVLVIWGSHADLYRATALNAGSHGLHARDGSSANAREMDVSGATNHGFYALHGSTINARCKVQSGGFGGANNCGGNGVFAQQNCTIEADEMSATDCGDAGVRADYGSTVNARAAICDRSNLGFAATQGGRVSAEMGRALNVNDAAVFASGGSEIDIAGGTLTSAGVVAITSRRGSRVNAQGTTGTGAGTRGAQATQGSTINANGANFRKNPAADTTGSNGDFVVFDGGQINATGATGGLNVTANTISQNGIIFR